MVTLHCADRRFFPQLSVSLSSVLGASRGIERAYVVLDGCGAREREILERIGGRFGAPVEALDACDVCGGRRTWPEGQDGRYARLLAASYIREDAALYMDADTVAAGDAGGAMEALGAGGGGWLVAGVEDTARRDARSEAGCGPGDPYINSGVLFMNLKPRRPYWSTGRAWAGTRYSATRGR